MWKLCGDYLKVTGWTMQALTHSHRWPRLTAAGNASSGTADSFLKATHLSRTRPEHQVTALALAKFQDAFMHNEEAKKTRRQEIMHISVMVHCSQHEIPWALSSLDHTERGIFLCMLKA